jgi:hypothetical protein
VPLVATGVNASDAAAAPADTGTDYLPEILIGTGCGLVAVAIALGSWMFIKRCKKTSSSVAEGFELQATSVQQVAVATAFAIPHSLPVHIPMAEVAVRYVTDGDTSKQDSKLPMAEKVVKD